jgi:hypothetical protein
VLVESFAVFAGPVPVELIGRQPERIHLPHIAMATRASFGDCAFAAAPPEIGGVVRGVFEIAGVSAVAIHARQPGLPVRARRKLLPRTRMTLKTGRLRAESSRFHYGDHGHQYRHSPNLPF